MSYSQATQAEKRRHPLPVAAEEPSSELAPICQQFFNRELAILHQRFNETYGRQVVVNLQVRSQVILAIISLHLLHQRIVKAGTHEKVRSDIGRFVKGSKKLQRMFDHLEFSYQPERRLESCNTNSFSLKKRLCRRKLASGAAISTW